MSSNTPYRSLYPALKGWYCRPLAEYPQDLRTWIECGLGLGMKPQRVQAWWDTKSPAARIAYAKQWDYQHDPAFGAARQDLEQTWDRYEELEREISRWEDAGTPTALDLAEQDKMLASLRPQLETTRRRLQQIQGDPLATEDIVEFVPPQDHSAGGQQSGRKPGRPKTRDKKGRILRHLIEVMTEGEEVDLADLPGSTTDLFDACRLVERSKAAGKCRVFSGSEDAFRSWLKASGYGFQGGRPPGAERGYWTRRATKTLPLINDEVFAEVSDAPHR